MCVKVGWKRNEDHTFEKSVCGQCGIPYAPVTSVLTTLIQHVLKVRTNYIFCQTIQIDIV